MKEISLYEQWLVEIGDSSAKTFKWSTTGSVSKWLVQNAEKAKGKQLSGSTEDRYHKSETPFRYEFTSDTTGTKYHVHIGGFFGKNLWISFMSDKPKDWQEYHCILGLGFGVDGAESDPETNLNEQFRVMATVVACSLDFIQRALDDGRIEIQEFFMNPKADGEEQRGIDSRRAKLYAPYIKGAFRKLKTKKNYYVDQTTDGFVLRFGTVRTSTGEIPDSVLAATFESENLINEDEISKIFKQKSTADTYLDMRDFWRAELGERDEDNIEAKKRMFDRAKIYSIPVNKIVPNQDYLNSETTLDYIEKGSTELPSGVKFKNGLVVVFDGHHRIAAQISKGQSSIQMKILKANF